MKHIVDVPAEERMAAVQAKVLEFLKKAAENDPLLEGWDHSWDATLIVTVDHLTTRKGYRGAMKYRWQLPGTFGSDRGTATVIVGPTDKLSVRVYQFRGE